MLLSSSVGNGGKSASGGAKGECESALELGVKLLLLLSAFFFWGGGGPVSFRAVKGEGGESALELCVLLSSSAGNGGESASGGAKGECESALELGVKLLLLLSAFCFWGGGGPVSFRGGEGGTVSVPVDTSPTVVKFPALAVLLMVSVLPVIPVAELSRPCWPRR